VVLEEQREDLAHFSGFFLIDDQAPAGRINIIAEYRCASDPLAFAARRRHLVARAFANDLAFELRERKQNVKGQPAK
jgi:hypothetical protein